ncbi:MAG: hypothetical protein M3548_13015 [Actinomycetota bacterium]|nr:hypothetical protein [Actinomycetota bacterium]
MRGPEVEREVDELAESVLRALRVKTGKNGVDGDREFTLRSRSSGRNGGAEARLAALRVLGVDALAPFVLAGRRAVRDDVELVRDSVLAFPAPENDDGPPSLWSLRDRALAQVLRSLDSEVVFPVPEWATADARGDGLGWLPWCAEMARLSSLALPEIHGPQREAAARRRLDLARGVTRAILRRDFLSAARLARWQALDHVEHPDPFLSRALNHMALLARGQSRVLLEITVATLLMEESR